MQTKTIIIDGKEYNLIPKEVVYEESYKVGDWVYGNDLGSSIYNNNKHPVEILEIRKDNFRYNLNSNSILTYATESSWLHNLNTITRKATKEEIENVKGTIIDMKHSEGFFQIHVIGGKAWYIKENKELSKEWIKEIIDSFKLSSRTGNSRSPYVIEVKTVDVGCMKDTIKEDWERVYKLLK